MCRGETRLDDAWDKKQVWRPHARTWGLSEANVLYWRKCLWHCDFLVPRSDSAPGELCPLAPLVTPLVVCNKNRKNSKNNQRFNSERHDLLFHEHLQFSVRHWSCTDCQQRLLAAFRASSCFFLSFLCLSHAFLRRGPVFVLLIIKLFRHWTSYFLKVR